MTLQVRAWTFDPLGGRQQEFWRGQLSALHSLPRPPVGTVWALEPIAGTFREREWAEFIELAEQHEIPGLSFRERRIDHKVLKLLPKAPGLRFLALEETPLKDDDLPELAHLQGLEHLLLHNRSKRITDAGLPALTNLDRLRTLHIHEGKLTDDAAEPISRMSSLQSIDLTSIFTSIRGAGLNRLAELPALEHLDLSLWRLTDARAQFIGDIPTLRSLTLRRQQMKSEKLSSDGLRFIGRLTRLERLDLDAHPLGDDFFQVLAKLPNLRFLRLLQPRPREERTATLTEAGVAALAACPRLEHVDFGPPLGLSPEEQEKLACFRRILREMGVGVPE